GRRRRGGLSAERDRLRARRSEGLHLQRQFFFLLLEKRILFIERLDLGLLILHVLARDADPDFAPAPQRQEKRRRGGQPPRIHAPRLDVDDVGRLFGEHAIADVRRRRDRREIARQ